MISQVTPTRDTELNLCENQLAEILDMIARYQGEHDEVWKRIFAIFVEQVGLEETGRFICDDGWVLSREIHRSSSKLDEEKLKKAIFEFLPKAKAQRLWNDITVIERKVDQAKLARAVENERIAVSVVESSVQEVKPVPHRVRRRATKQDQELMEVGVYASTAKEEVKVEG
jgi:hypothetical protein